LRRHALVADQLTVDRESVRDDVRLLVSRPAVAIGGVPLEASARTIQPIVLGTGDPALYKEPIENRDQVLGRRRWSASDRFRVRVRARVRLTGVDNLDHNSLHRDNVLDDSLTEVELHSVVGRECDGMSAVQPLKHLTEPSWIPSRTFRPQATASGKEGTNFTVDELVRLLDDAKAILLVV
jgi:hypothetical protein